MDIIDSQLGTMRIHFLDEGKKENLPVILLHGEPTWSYLYRKMIPILVNSGLRVIAPDLIGFGKSDKPAERKNYSYKSHINWLRQFLVKLKAQGAVLFAQDWGGLIGLRLLTAQPDKFSGLIVSNSGLPVGIGATEGFNQWLDYSQTVQDFNSGKIVYQGSMKKLDEAEIAAYNAPFPDETYKAGARAFPLLVPITNAHDQVRENIEAWEILKNSVVWLVYICRLNILSNIWLWSFSSKNNSCRNFEKFCHLTSLQVNLFQKHLFFHQVDARISASDKDLPV